MSGLEVQGGETPTGSLAPPQFFNHSFGSCLNPLQIIDIFLVQQYLGKKHGISSDILDGAVGSKGVGWKSLLYWVKDSI